MSINQVALTGNVVYQPTFKTSKGGTDYCRFVICVDKFIFDKEAGEKKNRPSFFNCVIFGKRCNYLKHHFDKGQKIAISGELQSTRFTNKEGEKVTSVSVLVDQVEFLTNITTASETHEDPEAQPDVIEVLEEASLDMEIPTNE